MFKKNQKAKSKRVSPIFHVLSGIIACPLKFSIQGKRDNDPSRVLTPGEFLGAAASGAREGLRDHVSLSAEGAIIFPIPPNAPIGVGPAGSFEVSARGVDGDFGLAVGGGAGGAAGVIFRMEPPQGVAAYSVSMAGGLGPGGAVQISFDQNHNVVDVSLTIGVGYRNQKARKSKRVSPIFHV